MLAVSHAGLLTKNEIFDAEYIKAPPNDQAGGTLRNVPHVEIFDAYWLLATLGTHSCAKGFTCVLVFIGAGVAGSFATVRDFRCLFSWFSLSFASSFCLLHLLPFVDFD
jgi:hypothetical protein